jgi:hypothetical protein
LSFKANRFAGSGGGGAFAEESAEARNAESDDQNFAHFNFPNSICSSS